MSEQKTGLIQAMDDLPWIVKIILCIPFLDIIWAVYRIVKGVEEKNTLILIFGILWIFPGCALCWILDLVTTIIAGKPTIFA